MAQEYGKNHEFILGREKFELNLYLMKKIKQMLIIPITFKMKESAFPGVLRGYLFSYSLSTGKVYLHHTK